MSASVSMLVVGPSWVGDMVMAQSLFIDLRQRYPQSVIDVIAPAWSIELLQRMPQVRQAYVLEVAHGELGLRKRWHLAKRLRDNHYQHAIVLPRSYKAALVPFWAKIPKRTGFRSEMRYGVLNDLRPLDPRLDQTVKRFVALGAESAQVPEPLACPQPSLEVDPNNTDALIDKLGLQVDKPVIGFMPGAEYGPAKQWPVERFAELASSLGQQDYQVWVLGSQKEYELGRRVRDIGGEHVINLCGKTRLVDVIDLMPLISAAVSNDSGLMHMAAATGRPLIAIYGSSSPAFTPPLSDQATVEYLNLSCSPCFKRQCPFGHYYCLQQISSQMILQRLQAVI